MRLNGEQQRVARTLLREGKRIGASKRQIKAAIETGLVESNLTNIRGGDRDSSGWRQERASSYPGKNRNDVAAGARRFYQETRGKKGSAGSIAQQAQRSAFPARYDQRGKQAESIIRSLGGYGGGGGGGGGGRGGGGRPGLPASRGNAGYRPTDVQVKQVPDFDAEGFEAARRAAIVGQFLQKRRPQSSLFRSGILSTETPRPEDFTSSKLQTKTVRSNKVVGAAKGRPAIAGQRGSSSGGGGGGNGREGTFRISGPNPGRLKPALKAYARAVAGAYGSPLTGSDGTGHSKMTTSGNVSAHFSGNATDMPARGAKLTRMGQAALIAAGMNPKKARRIKGGLHNVGGKQIIFNTNTGGNHFDHLHIGLRGK